LGPVDQLNSQNLAPEISPPIAAGPPPVGITCCTRVGDGGPGITHQKRSRRARWAGPGQQLLLRLVDSAGDMTLPAGEGGGSTREQEPSTSSSLRLLSDSNCTMPCPLSLSGYLCDIISFARLNRVRLIGESKWDGAEARRLMYKGEEEEGLRITASGKK